MFKTIKENTKMMRREMKAILKNLNKLLEMWGNGNICTQMITSKLCTAEEKKSVKLKSCKVIYSK